MKAADAQKRMPLLEEHPEHEYSVEQYVHWLLSLADEGSDAVGRVMQTEIKRARLLAVNYYRKVSGRVAIGSADIDVAIAFMQGATFAAAALGADPPGHPGGD